MLLANKYSSIFMYIYKKFTNYIGEVKILEKMSLKRSKIRIYLYLFTLFFVLFIALVMSSIKADRLSRQLNASSQRALTELEEYVSSINTSLTKGMYANSSALLGDIASDLIRDSAGAKTALSALPISDSQIDNTSKFLSQVGAFVSALNKELSSNKKLSEKEIKQINTLIDYSEKLADELSSMNEGVQSGNMSFSDSVSTLEKSDKEIKSLSTALSDIRQTAGDYPSLIYDGPFSDHILNQKPKLLEDKDKISKKEAKKKAAHFLDANESKLTFVDEENGDIPAYVFSSDGNSIAITKKGGYVVYMLGSTFAGEISISEEEAIDRASQFLTANGYSNMKDSYYSVTDGICTVNFAYFRGEILYYPDLIKVSINLENGSVVSFDARGFIMNHKDRNLNSPAISKKDSQKNISPLLSVISSRLAVIPTDYASEKLCYEFHCKNKNNEEFLVYIDTKTGEEADILILLYSDNGILTK